MGDLILDTIIDTLKLLPFLFVAFLLIELFEHKFKNIALKKMKHNTSGVIVGSLLGSVPQCGFSVLATNLYVTRIISLGTLIAIYLSTSDEMLPVMLSEKVGFPIIFKVILFKILIGIIFGIIIDLIYRKKQVADFNICEECHHNCEKSILKSSIIHSVKIASFILIISFLVNLIIYYIGEDNIASIVKGNELLTPFISSLIGLIPNCASSVILTELYISKFISFGSMLAGLLSGSGTAFLVLFKSNKNIKENFMIISIVYLIGAICGVIINMVM